MSRQGDPTKAEAPNDEWKPRSATKRSRKRPYIIEWRVMQFSRKGWSTWAKFSAYEKKSVRDTALELKQRVPSKYMQYRAGNDE